jgi:glycosyltransferase involved in cell wall biosynthesis
VFDPDWLSSSGGPGTVPAYVDAGQTASPHPLVHLRWYATRVRGAARSNVGPFAHYLLRGAPRGDAIHPLIDAERYLEQRPGATEHRAGILGDYLEDGWRSGVELNGWFDARRYRAARAGDDHTPAIIELARTAPRWLREWDRPGRGGPQPGPTSRAGRSHVEALADVVVPRGDGPLVTVVLPVRDRSNVIVAAVRSVLEQTLDDLELLVIDDGSVDDLGAVLQQVDDPRLRIIVTPPRGAYAARQRGLEEARGRFIAYLDSDEVWRPQHLQLLVAALIDRGGIAAFDAVEESDESGTTRVHVPRFDAPAEAIDDDLPASCLVHAAGAVTWEPELTRAGTLAVALRLRASGDLRWVPAIGVERAIGGSGDRVRARGLPGDRDLVLDRGVGVGDDVGDAAEHATTAGVTAVIVARDPARVSECVAAVARTAPNAGIVVVDPADDPVASYRYHYLASLHESVVHLRAPWHAATFGACLRHAARRVASDVVVVLDEHVVVQDGWVEAMRAGLADVPLVQGKVVDIAGVVRSTGYVVPDGDAPYDLFQGAAEVGPEASRPGTRAAVSPLFFAAARRTILAAEELPGYATRLAGVALSAAARVHGGAVRYVPDAVGLLHHRPTEGDALDALEFDRRRLERQPDRLPADERERLEEVGLEVLHRRVSLTGTLGPAAGTTPVVSHVRSRERPLRFAIKAGPPDVTVRRRWGDWHFALALRTALEARGHDVSVDLMHGWYRPTAHLDDVVVVLRGRHRYVPDPDQVNLVWVISHPDLTTVEELRRYDEVLVASYAYASALEQRTGLRTRPLLQCTDATRFVPGEEDADRHEVLFVGNSRGVFRPIVHDALEAGLALSVFGAHWEQMLDGSTLRGTFVENTSLPALYRSAGVVLNDHWDDMRREGFVSNRLFDLAACGANVVTDPIAGLDELFDGCIRSYSSPADLGEVVGEALRDREAERERRLELSRRVRQDHSFDARAGELEQLAREHLARA